MKTEAEFVPLPPEFRGFRDSLRIVGYELVRYTNAHARAEAGRYRHPIADYEYAIHKIESIQAEDGQIFINSNAFYSSAARVPDWINYYTEKEKPEGFSLVKRWFTNPVSALLTVVVPPYGLAMLGLVAAGDRMNRKEQNDRRQSLPRLSEMPKFLPRRGA
jgi:hypothetical protein